MKCRKNTEIKYPKVAGTKYGRIMLLQKYEVRDSKKLKFIKEQEATGLLSSLGINPCLNEILSLGPPLFWYNV